MAFVEAKKIYTEESLASWAEKIKNPWKTFFTKAELSLGEEIFYNGEIRELEINEYDLMVHARFDQEETYSLVDWKKGEFSARGSTDDKLLCRSLAVAGLLEVGKLIADVGAGDVEVEADKPMSALDKIMAARKGGAATEAEAEGAKKKVKKEKKVEVARPLALEFYVHSSKGLVFKAHWIGVDGEYIPALKGEGHGAAEANSAERAQLISLASAARKCGFKFSAKEGLYGVKDVEKVELFFREELSKWEEKYEVLLQAGLELVDKGAREVEVKVELEACDEGMFDFSWHMEVCGDVLGPEEARLMIRKHDQVHLVEFLGLVTFSKDRVELLATWRRWINMYNDGRIPRYLLCSLFGDEAIQVSLGKELKSWKDSLFKKPKAVKSVPTFLRPYQKQGVKWLNHICDTSCHGLLADEMGLGKTVQILSFLNTRQNYDLPNLIVCPASVVPVWRSEAERFFPDLKVEVLKSGHDFYKTEGKVLWVASYTQLRMHKYLLEEQEFGYAVLDEAQLIKNPEAKVSQACMRIRAKHRVVLTGTPLENRYLDLWTLFRFLMPGLLGTRKAFEERFSKDTDVALKALRKQIAPFVLRRTKKDVLKELPCKTEADAVCPLMEKQRIEYDRLSKEGVALLGEDIPQAVKEKSLSFLTLLTRLRQVCCDPGLLPWVETPVCDSGKIGVLLENLQEVLSTGHKVVIFSQFVSLLDRVESAVGARFPEVPLYKLTGKTVDRGKPVEGFQAEEGPGVILVSLRAGGTGITLHSADYVFLMDPWWNPAVEEQAIDRVHRFGQEKPVFVYRMITAGTVEARIQSLKSEKKGLFSNIMGGLNDISDMRNYFESLSELVALIPEDHAH